MKNLDNKKNKKSVNIEESINSSTDKANLILTNRLNNFRSNIEQDFILNINELKTKYVNLNSVTLNKNLIENYINKEKSINLETKQSLKSETKELSKLDNSSLTFVNLLKGLDINLEEFEINKLNLKSFNGLDKNLNINNLNKVKSDFSYISDPKMESNGYFMSLSSTNDFYFYLINALNFIKNKKSKNVITSNPEFNKENKNNLIFKIRHYLNLLTKYNFNLSTSYYNFFQFKKNNKYLFKMEKATELLKLAFLAKGCLISKPIFNFVYPYDNIIKRESNKNLDNLKVKTKNYNKPKIIIHLFYYIKTRGLVENNNNLIKIDDSNINASDLGNDTRSIFNKTKDDSYITSIYKDKFVYLCNYLSKLFGAEIELELVRLYQPYQDSNILVQYLNSNSYNIKFILAVSRLFKEIKIYRRKNLFNLLSLQEIKNQNNQNSVLLNDSVSFPSGISGINIKLAGRPMKERIIPRFTVKRAQRGNFNKLNTKMIEKSMFTDKTKKGSFNFTVRLSHIFK